MHVGRDELQERVLEASVLAGLATNKVELKITSLSNFPTHYQIGEVVVSGDIAAVPEPTSIALFGIMAVGGMAYGWRRRNQASAV